MIIVVPAYQHEDVAKLAEKAIREHKKLSPSNHPDWQDELNIELIKFTYQQMMGKVFILYAHFDVRHLSQANVSRHGVYKA